MISRTQATERSLGRLRCLRYACQAYFLEPRGWSTASGVALARLQGLSLRIRGERGLPKEAGVPCIKLRGMRWYGAGKVLARYLRDAGHLLKLTALPVLRVATGGSTTL